MSLTQERFDPRTTSDGAVADPVWNSSGVERAESSPRRVRVGVCEENEILSRGLVAALTEDRGLEVTSDGKEQIDVAVVSSRTASARRFPCPVVVCCGNGNDHGPPSSGNDVVGVLDCSTLTSEQLLATVHAAAAGLRISGISAESSPPQLDPRSQQVLELLADGFSTREIALHMSYSERTIKKLLTRLQRHFGARSRAQVVARAIRSGLI